MEIFTFPSGFTCTIRDLHLLWPLGTAAIQCLAYWLRPTLNGEVPAYTDKFLGKTWLRTTETVARWRARWEALGIIKTIRRGGQTYYSLNLVTLEAQIRAAQLAKEQADQEARDRKLAQRVQRADEVAEILRQQWRDANIPTQHDLDLQPDIVPIQQETDLQKEYFVLDEPEKADCGDPQPLPSKPPIPTIPKPVSSSSIPQDLQWFMTAAQRLVIASGESWSPTLQKALEALDPNRLINTVSALWEQTLKGNVRSAARWLNQASQKARQGPGYRPSKAFKLPSQLPPLPTAAPIAPTASPGPIPPWIPTWAKPVLDQIVQAVGCVDRILEVDGGVEAWFDGRRQFIPDPRGPYALL